MKVRVCPKCNGHNSETTRKCARCGTRLPIYTLAEIENAQILEEEQSLPQKSTQIEEMVSPPATSVTTHTKVRVCPKCNKHNAENAWNCVDCGATLPITSLVDLDSEQTNGGSIINKPPEIHSLVSRSSQSDGGGMKYIEQTSSQIIFCSNCGEKLSNDANFCWKCGKEVKQAIEPRQVTSTPLQQINRKPVGEVQSSNEPKAIYKRVLYRWKKQGLLELIPQQKVGELRVYDNWMEFRNWNTSLQFFPIRMVSFDQPMSFPQSLILKAMRVDYGNMSQPAYFMDFRFPGGLASGLFGGNNRMIVQTAKILQDGGSQAEIDFTPSENETWKRVAIAIGCIVTALIGLSMFRSGDGAGFGLFLIISAIAGTAISKFWQEVDNLSGLSKFFVASFCFLGMMFGIVIVAFIIGVGGAIASDMDNAKRAEKEARIRQNVEKAVDDELRRHGL